MRTARFRVHNTVLQFLKRQNPDGGWGYRGGGSSWLEPTVYAALALHGTEAAERAMGLLSRWQTPAGAWIESPRAPRESWATALAVILRGKRGESPAALRQDFELMPMWARLRAPKG